MPWVRLTAGGVEVLFVTLAGGSSHRHETLCDIQLNAGETSRRMSQVVSELEWCSNLCMDEGVKRMGSSMKS